MFNRPSKEIVLFQILIIFVLPVFLIYFGLVFKEARFFLLSVSALIIYSIMVREKWSYFDLDLRIDNIKSALPYYTMLVLFFVSILFALEHFLNIDHTNTPEVILQRLLFFIPVSVMQEFAFSVFLLKRLKIILKHKILVVLANAVFFTFIHIIYAIPPAVALFLFLGASLAYWVYWHKPNFLLVSIAHAIVNITAVLLGFFI